jgi:hypothetical protein
MVAQRLADMEQEEVRVDEEVLAPRSLEIVESGHRSEQQGAGAHRAARLT